MQNPKSSLQALSKREVAETREFDMEFKTILQLASQGTCQAGYSASWKSYHRSLHIGYFAVPSYHSTYF